uniref:Reverse transcriptase domain-containing protein n=1 Tax=Tanacetum cinerariifolium TaxID=118510 RepID=A0A6L2LI83_TANCI|nr:hypothetical protein [Tanacetum cinerariifolium]
MFIDDILIYLKSKEDHDVYLRLVLELLKKDRPSKIEVVKNWKAPKTPSEIQSFLRLAGYYQRFIDNLGNAPILSLPNGAEDIVVYCDVSNQGLGYVLMQTGKIRYHPWKANVVADALSRKERVKPKMRRSRKRTRSRNVAWLRSTNGKEGRWRLKLEKVDWLDQSWYKIQLIKWYGLRKGSRRLEIVKRAMPIIDESC